MSGQRCGGRFRRWGLAILLASVSPVESATIYRCTAEDGGIVLSDRPCGADAVEQYECLPEDGGRMFDEHGCAPPPDRMAAARSLATNAIHRALPLWPWILPPLALLLVWQAPPLRRWRRRRGIRRQLRRGLDRKRYQVYWPPPALSGLTAADALIVSAHGVFQLRVLDTGGRISGREYGDHWCRSGGFRKREFANPLLALDRGQFSTADTLGINRPTVHPLVVLASGVFDGERPPRLVLPDELLRGIESFGERQLEPEQVARVNQALAN